MRFHENDVAATEYKTHPAQGSGLGTEYSHDRHSRHCQKIHQLGGVPVYIEVFGDPAEAGDSTLGHFSPVEFEKVNEVS